MYENVDFDKADTVIDYLLFTGVCLRKCRFRHRIPIRPSPYEGLCKKMFVTVVPSKNVPAPDTIAIVYIMITR